MIDKKVLQDYLLQELIRNAPVRDETKYPKAYGKSPYPGNLKANGIYLKDNKNGVTIHVGGEPVPYAVYTETRSRKKGWQRKSVNQFLDFCRRCGGEVK